MKFINQSFNPVFATLFLSLSLFWACTDTQNKKEESAQTIQISWEHLSSKNGEIPAPGPSTQQTASLILDVDKDGVNDFVIASRKEGPAVLWYRRLPEGWEKYVIEPAMLPVEAGGGFYDIDGDSDKDFVFTGDGSSNMIWWWENPYPDFSPDKPWKRHIIKDSGANKHHDNIFGDFDGDGKMDLVFWNQRANALCLAKIPEDPISNLPWPYTEIFNYEDKGVLYEGLYKADIDGDGLMDIIGAGMWFKYKKNSGFYPVNIDPDQRYVRAAAGQLKEGGIPEVVFVSGDANGPLRWYEATGNPEYPDSWVGHELLDTLVIHGHSLQIADINGDGFLDIFNAEMHTPGHEENATCRIFYGDGKGNFELSVISKGIGNHESRIADLDGDGDLDILTKPYTWDAPRIDVWLNNGTAKSEGLSLDKWERHLIEEELPHRAVYITAGDIDGDGNNDIIAGGWWYKNPGNPGGKWQRNVIGSPLNNMAIVHDFDGDGHLDILGTKGEGASANAEFVWAKNNGNGNFIIHDNIPAAQGDFLQGVAIARFMPNGPLEVALSWHRANQGLQMFTIPDDPVNERWKWRKISEHSEDEDLGVADINGNGYIDLYLGTSWLENPGNSHDQWKVHLIGETTQGLADRIAVHDFTGDGHFDAVVGLEHGTDILMFSSQGNPTEPWFRRVMAVDVGGGFSMDAADMTGNGKIDVVLGEHRGKPSNRLIIYENLGGIKWHPHVIDYGLDTGIDHHDGTQIFDMDGDGDMDIISIGWYNPKIWVYENKAN